MVTSPFGVSNVTAMRPGVPCGETNVKSMTVDVESADPESTLSLYRRALALRRELQTDENLEWVESGRDDVLWFRRPNGWEVVTNFGSSPYRLEGRDVLLSSAPTPDGVVAGETTVWLAP